MSRPIVVTVCMLGSSKPYACLAPLNCGGLNSTHIHGTHVPVEERSTASIGDIAHLVKNERGRELRRPKQEAPATTMTVTTGVSQCGSDPKGANQKGRN